MRRYAGDDDSRWQSWESFTTDVLENVKQYQVPVIKLTKETPKEAVCTVFEKVNTGGVPLNVFELLTATYAGDREYFAANGEDFQLTDHWKRVKSELSAYAMLGQLESTDFLQAVCFVSTHFQRRGRPGADPCTQPAASCKRKDILYLPLPEYVTWAPRIVAALRWSGRFLTRQGIFGAIDLPYRSQIPPLAAIRTVLGDESDTPQADSKITQWYWRGVLALLMKQGCVDWTYTKEPIDATIFDDQQVDLALVFPKAWCDKNRLPRERQNSIVNKTPLTHRARRIIGNRAPDTYIAALEAESGLQGNWLDDIISTHLIDAANLRAPDFNAFYASRSAELIGLIEDAIGKRAVPQSAAPESAADYQPEQLR